MLEQLDLQRRQRNSRLENGIDCAGVDLLGAGFPDLSCYPIDTHTAIASFCRSAMISAADSTSIDADHFETARNREACLYTCNYAQLREDAACLERKYFLLSRNFPRRPCVLKFHRELRDG